MVRYHFALVTCLPLLIVLQVGQMGVKLETRFGGADFVRVQWRSGVLLLLHSVQQCVTLTLLLRLHPNGMTYYHKF
jgi:hypothetical protein